MVLYLELFVVDSSNTEKTIFGQWTEESWRYLRLAGSRRRNNHQGCWNGVHRRAYISNTTYGTAATRIVSSATSAGVRFHASCIKYQRAIVSAEVTILAWMVKVIARITAVEADVPHDYGTSARGWLRQATAAANGRANDARVVARLTNKWTFVVRNRYRVVRTLGTGAVDRVQMIDARVAVAAREAIPVGRYVV